MIELTEKDVRMKTSRASGPGGQRVNKRSTRVQLWVKIDALSITDEEKQRAREHLAKHINHDDEFEVSCDDERFQERNREIALSRMNEMLHEAIKKPEERIPTIPPAIVEERRLHDKKMHADKKRTRREHML